jgi:hypothetical protein
MKQIFFFVFLQIFFSELLVGSPKSVGNRQSSVGNIHPRGDFAKRIIIYFQQKSNFNLKNK